jgi:hypothetical protein
MKPVFKIALKAFWYVLRAKRAAVLWCFVSWQVLFKHKHRVEDHWFVCEECLDMSKRLTLHLCEAIQKYYSKLAVVFSGCQGFHVHVMDFDYHDWIPYREKDPQIFLKASIMLGLRPEECVVIEDAPNGIRAAKKGNMKCIAITTTHKAEELTEADMIINAFTELTFPTLQRLDFQLGALLFPFITCRSRW